MSNNNIVNPTISRGESKPESGHDGLGVPGRYFAILAVGAGSLMTMIDGTIGSVALPSIAKALHVPASSTVLIIMLYQLILAMTIMPFSALGDHIGQRRLYQAGLGVYLLAASGCLFANSLLVLLLVRGVQALSAGAAFSVTFGLIRSIYPARHLGKGLGINTLCAAGGGAIAPLIGGLILSVASWRWVFMAGVPLAIVSLLMSVKLPETVRSGRRFDIAGAALCAATFALVIWGLDGLNQGQDWRPAALLLALGIGTGIIFVRHQLCSTDTVLPVDLLARPAFSLAVSGALSGALGSMTMMLSLPFRLHDRGVPPAEMGAMIAPYAIASFMIAPGAGMLSDRLSPKWLGLCGLLIALAAMILIAFLPAHVSFIDMAWRMWLCGAGFALFMSPNARILLSAAPGNRAAAAGGLMTTTRMLGQALAATLVGALLSAGLGTGACPVLVAMGFVAIALICALAQPRRSTIML